MQYVKRALALLCNANLLFLVDFISMGRCFYLKNLYSLGGEGGGGECDALTTMFERGAAYSFINYSGNSGHQFIIYIIYKPQVYVLNLFYNGTTTCWMKLPESLIFIEQLLFLHQL